MKLLLLFTVLLAVLVVALTTTIEASVSTGGGSVTVLKAEPVSDPPLASPDVQTAIFGLSLGAALIIAAALLIVVILAIVAMTRSGETTHIDRDRRL